METIYYIMNSAVISKMLAIYLLFVYNIFFTNFLFLLKQKNKKKAFYIKEIRKINWPCYYKL